MRWGDVKRILREANSTEDPNVINYSSEKAMVEDAYKRLKAHADQYMLSTETHDHYIGYLDRENSSYNLVVTQVNLLLNRKGSYAYKNPSVQVVINLDPINHVVRVSKEWGRPPKRLLKKVCDEIDNIISPTTTDDGLWWADENYYPLRPMWKGESVDKKPRKTWTVVNAATGDVISEGAHHVDEAVYNPECIDLLCEAALNRIRVWCEEREASGGSNIAYLDGGFYEDEGQAVYVEESNEKRSMFRVMLADPVSPEVVVERSRTGNGGVKRDVEWIQQTIERLTELAVPKPAADGTWWADENYYSIRPVWEGEDVALKPKPNWTVIDGATGSVIKESRGHAVHKLGLNPKSVDAVRREIMERMLATIGNSEAPGSKVATSRYVLSLMDDDDDSGLMPHAGSHCLNIVVFDDEAGEAAVGIQVDIEDPLRANVDVVESWSDADEDAIEDIIDGLSEDARPEAATSGLWWGDVDFYPIRPLYVGEAVELKPEPSCTVVDGTSGDVVSEATEVQGSDRLSTTDSRNMWHMTELAAKRLSSYLKNVESEVAPHKFSVKMHPGLKYMYAYLSDRHLFSVHLSDVKPEPVVGLTPYASSDFEDEILDWFADHKFDIVDVVSPHLRDDGLWWADENLYPQRPVWEGEHFPPVEGWSAIDPVTGEDHDSRLR